MADNGTGGNQSPMAGAALTLAQGDWAWFLPATNISVPGHGVQRCLPATWRPFYQEGAHHLPAAPSSCAAGPLNGYTLIDLGLVATAHGVRASGMPRAAAGTT